MTFSVKSRYNDHSSEILARCIAAFHFDLGEAGVSVAAGSGRLPELRGHEWAVQAWEIVGARDVILRSGACVLGKKLNKYKLLCIISFSFLMTSSSIMGEMASLALSRNCRMRSGYIVAAGKE